MRQNADLALKIMLDEIKRYATEGPTEAELAATKDYLVGNFALRFDSSQKIARNLLQFQMDHLGIDYIERRNALIRAVSIDDIRRVVRHLWRLDVGGDRRAGEVVSPRMLVP